MSNWFENHQPQRTQTSTITDAPFIPNSIWMAFSVDRKFSDRILSTPDVSFDSQGCWWQILHWFFQHFLLRFVDFASQFGVRCKILFHEKPLESSLTVAWFSWTNHNFLLRIATNEIASIFIDNGLRQMTFFVFGKVGKGRLSSNDERFWNKKAAVVCFFIIWNK